jgi:hypothetical protein
MIVQKEVVIILNGSLIGLQHQFIDGIVNLQRKLRQDSIHIFIHTWDFSYNNIWLENLKNKISFPTYRRIKLHVVSEKYNDNEPYNFFHSFQSYLGLDDETIETTVGKRCLYYYTLVKALQAVKKYNSDAYVMRFSPTLALTTPFPVGFPKHSLIGNLLDIHFDAASLLNGPTTGTKGLADIFVVHDILQNSLDDKAFYTSFKVLEKLFTCNIEEFFVRMKEVYAPIRKKLFDFYGTDKMTPEHLRVFLIDHLSVYNENGYIINEFIKRYSPELPIMKINIFDWIRNAQAMTNPWIKIHPERVECVTPCVTFDFGEDIRDRYLCGELPDEYVKVGESLR